jgi:hypothetical protein
MTEEPTDAEGADSDAVTGQAPEHVARMCFWREDGLFEAVPADEHTPGISDYSIEFSVVGRKGIDCYLSPRGLAGEPHQQRWGVDLHPSGTLLIKARDTDAVVRMYAPGVWRGMNTSLREWEG